MSTLADIIADPSLLDGFKWEEDVDLACSYCGETFKKQKGRTLKAAKAGQPGCYCSSACRGAHTIQLATVVQDGVKGRICTDCGEWVPMDKMTAKGRGRVCRACKRKQPKQVFTTLRSKAKHRGVEWTLTFEETMAYWDEPCWYCGDAVPGVALDRIDSSRGYVPGNVRSCCYPCNRGKGDGSAEEFIARCRAAVSTLGREP